MERDHDAVIEARLQAVIASAHRPLSDDEQGLVRKRIERDLKHREEMRAIPLANGDGPDPSFSSFGDPTGGRQW